jgi:predicted nucleic acid-binding protein
VATLKQRFAHHQLIGLDTAIFIYHFEGHATYLPLTRVILEVVQSGQCTALVSTVAIMELTVQAWRVHRADIARQYEVLLANFPHIKLVDVTRDVARQAARLRATYNLRPADALQVASALVNGATLWVSNDKQLTRLEPELEVLILDEFVE